MPFKIINKQILADHAKRIDILAPNIARNVQPGQFVRVCPEEDDDHIPLTVTSCDPIRGHISLIFPEIGSTTRKLGAIAINDSVHSICGPLGCKARIEREGHVVCIATGIGIAQILPICKAYKNIGNKVIGIMGAKTKRALMLEPQMRIACDKLLIATEDGSYERKGLATDLLQGFIGQKKINCAYAIGSVAMMNKVSAITERHNIKTLVKLNPMMADCMGMCGSCRVRVGGKTVLACIDGPEFDGHQVDYEDLIIRMNAYEESGLWNDPSSKDNLQRSESKTLTRFLSGLIKS